MVHKIPIFVPFSIKNDEMSVKEHSAMLGKSILQTIKNSIKTDFSIGIGKYYKNLDCMIHSYHESLKALSCCAPNSAAHIDDIFEEDLKSDYPKQYEEILLEKASHGQTEETLDAFSPIFNWLSEKYFDSIETVKSKLVELVILMNRYSIPDGNQIFPDYMSEVMYIHDVGTLNLWCREKIVVITNRIKYVKSIRQSIFTIKAREFINNNYSNQITLDDVAKEININPHYFSRLFKEETGENFIDYLTNVRIEKSKELLNTTNLSVKEICYLVGYNDPNYFCRIFKKTEGVTPTEFKSMPDKY